jgi:uncharacterized protein YndB with AHSA1/START domain
MTTQQTAETTRVFRVFIKATPEAIWEAVTTPEWTRRYGYGASQEFELRPGGAFKVLGSQEMKAHGGPEVIIDGEVIEAEPPRRLVQTFRFLWRPPGFPDEGFTRVTWEIEPVPEPPAGITRVTVIHELDGAPMTALTVAGEDEMGGGWPLILSDLKTLLETGRGFQG